ncbi:hypothetical protein CHARACLAT_030897 [Characodon lateralis]|uniref:Uncharacterized protein n=1 Tax=Characodon lateralis TaxID=208331 RepID=A0ABU7F7T6_9TELE|nr:hypothetical protein [Characodon lateralis]
MTLLPGLNPGLSEFWRTNKFGQIPRKKSCSIKSRMDAISPDQTRFSPKCLPVINVATSFSGHHLDSQWLNDSMRLNMSSLVRSGRGPEKITESDIVLANLHTKATLTLVTSD